MLLETSFISDKMVRVHYNLLTLYKVDNEDLVNPVKCKSALPLERLMDCSCVSLHV